MAITNHPHIKRFATVALIIVCTFGLPALAAGRMDWFVGDWAATAFVALVGSWLAIVIFSRYQLPGRGIDYRLDAGRVLFILAFLVDVTWAVYDRTHHVKVSVWPGWSLVLSLVGLGLLMLAAHIGLAAMRDLAHYAYTAGSMTETDRVWVTQGIYHILRHPIYTALLLEGLGLPLILASLRASAVVFVLIGFGLILRIRSEEKTLITEFGDYYRNYQKDTWRVIPHIF